MKPTIFFLSAFVVFIFGVVFSIQFFFFPIEVNKISPHSNFVSKNSIPRNINLSPIKHIPRDYVVIFSGVPLDDVGGGQRSAQLAQALIQRLCHVTIVYNFPKFDFELGKEIHSKIDKPFIRQIPLSEYSFGEANADFKRSSAVIVELPHKNVIPFAEIASKTSFLVVELIDAWWDKALGGDWYNESNLQYLIKLSHRFVITAKSFIEKFPNIGINKNLVYVPNAANDREFNKYLSFDVPKNFPSKKVCSFSLLYFGSLYGSWFGWDWIIDAAVLNPSRCFLIIGQIPNGAPKTPKNVIFLGAIEHQHLPKYLYHSNAAIIPFVGTKSLLDSISPIKVYEYLFLEKPVISSPMREVLELPGVVTVSTSKEFATACSEIFRPINNDFFIATNTWSYRIDQLIPIHKKLYPSYSFIVLIHNNENIISRFLSTLLIHTQKFDHEIIVVDNASTDNGPHIVETEFKKMGVSLYRNKVNGCSSGRNLGVKHSSNQMLVFLDSDMWFTSSSWIIEATTILQAYPNIGSVGWAAGWISDIARTTGPIVDYLPNRGENEETEKIGVRTDISYLGSGGMFIPRHVWDKTQGFDERFDPTIFEDTDLSYQIRSIGYTLGYRNFNGIMHHSHQTTKSDSNTKAYIELYARNANRFKEKWKRFLKSESPIASKKVRNQYR